MAKSAWPTRILMHPVGPSCSTVSAVNPPSFQSRMLESHLQAGSRPVSPATMCDSASHGYTAVDFTHCLGQSKFCSSNSMSEGKSKISLDDSYPHPSTNSFIRSTGSISPHHGTSYCSVKERANSSGGQHREDRACRCWIRNGLVPSSTSSVAVEQFW